MKINNLLSTLILLTALSPVLAQEEQPKTVNRIRISDIYIQTGSTIEPSTTGTRGDFNELAPNSVLLEKGLEASESSPYNGFDMRGNNMFSVILGVDFRDKHKTAYKANPHLRLGFSYFSGTSLMGGLYKEDHKPYDTLTSTQTGQTVYMDSLTTKDYRMNYSSQQLRFDGSLIFRTNPEARWSLFAGIGITAGMSINAHTDISYNRTEDTEIIFPNGNRSYSNSSYSGDTNEREVFRNKNNFGLSVYIPMGIDFRLGNKKEFWKRTHLFYELRPGIDITSIPELRTITNPCIQQTFGLKVSF